MSELLQVAAALTRAALEGQVSKTFELALGPEERAHLEALTASRSLAAGHASNPDRLP